MLKFLDEDISPEDEAKLDAYMEQFDLLMKDDIEFLVKSNEVINALNDEDYLLFLAFNNCSLMVTAHANTNADIEALSRLRTARVVIKVMHEAIGSSVFSEIVNNSIRVWLDANLTWVREVSIPIMQQGIDSIKETYALLQEMDTED